jgi:hypothetical protein
MSDFDKSKPHSRMQAIMHYFSLQTIEEKKEYAKLTKQDREELAVMLKKEGYNITDEGA